MSDQLRAVVHPGCKQVKVDDEHFADAATPEAAQVIADCINYAGLPERDWPPDVIDRVVKYFQ